VEVSGVKEIFAKHVDEESKGIKVHFKIDENGVLVIEKIDVSFEKESAVNAETDESTFASNKKFNQLIIKFK